MPTLSSVSGARILAGIACLFFCLAVNAQTAPAPLVSTVHTVAASTTGVPVEKTFNISAAGTYQITLQDLGAQMSPAAPLATVKLAISGPDNMLVTLVPQTGSTVDSSKTQLTGAGSATFTVAAGLTGDYIIHVIGAPTLSSTGTPVPNSGGVSMIVTNTGTAQQLYFFTDQLAIPPTNIQVNVGSLSDTFTVPASGNYVVTLTDMQVPAQLKHATLGILPPGGSLLTDPAFGTSDGDWATSTPATAPTATVTLALQAGVTYVLIAGGQADTAGTGAAQIQQPNAGLFGINIAPQGGGAPVYGKSVPVGMLGLAGSPSLTPGSYTLSFNDLAFPAALGQIAAAVTLNGQSVAQLNASGTSNAFTAVNAAYQVFAVGLPASGNGGSYTLTLQPSGGAPVLSLARAVTDPASGLFAYSYDTTTVGGETYTLNLADFGYPNSFQSLQAGVVQNGVQLDKSNPPSVPTGTPSVSETLTPAAGPLTLLVFAKPAAAASSNGSGGLFGINLTANGAGAPALETSQGVGALFSVQKATVTTGGEYQVVVKDLGFPANFANLSVIVTRGTSKIGSVFGGGNLNFSATGGDYLINFVAQPATAQAPAKSDLAGTYSMVVQQAPPAATVTLEADPSTVASGGTVTLKWSSANTTSCIASSSPAGAWSGPVKTTDTATTPALTANTTFTVTCTGSDGTSPTATAAVTVTSSSGSGGGGGGGGGSIELDVVALLLGVLGLRSLRTLPWRNQQ